MAIINQRWPSDLAPERCVFASTRNDVIQISPRTRQSSVIRQGRRLWTADLTWRLPNTERLARLRYLLEGLAGFAGSAQIWDFSSPSPEGLLINVADQLLGRRVLWRDGNNTYTYDFGGFPAHWNPGAGGVALTVAAVVNATQITVGGIEPSKVAVIQGQYVQVGRRLYLSATTVFADGAGVATITLQSPLIAAAGIGAEVRFVEAACEMRLAEQSWPSQRTGGSLVEVSARFIETAEDYV